MPCSTDDWKADVGAMAAAVTENTALIVGSACSYPHGVVDPIRALGEVALARGCLLHVDGCIGGFVLPYFNRIRAGGDADGFDDPVGQAEFDFGVPGVTSISVDLHKYAFCPKGASVIVYRDKELRNYQLYGAFFFWRRSRARCPLLIITGISARCDRCSRFLNGWDAAWLYFSFHCCQRTRRGRATPS